MAYVTGTANSLSDLLSAVQNACTSNGWTLSGDVLHKGTCYVELVIDGTSLSVRGGRGIDSNHALTDPCNTPVGQLLVSGAVTYPVIYDVHVHIDPDEVYVIAHYNISYYETMAFGQSNMPGLPGSGNWYAGCAKGGAYGWADKIGSDGPRGYASVYMMLCHNSNDTCFPNGVDHSLDGPAWDLEGAYIDWASLAFRQPNEWNQESILVPIRVYVNRPDGYLSVVLECGHARYVVITNMADEQIITLGADRWKVYPFLARGEPYTTDGSYGSYSGQFGHAIRYDGP